MKLTKSKLRQIVKEELTKITEDEDQGDQGDARTFIKAILNFLEERGDRGDAALQEFFKTLGNIPDEKMSSHNVKLALTTLQKAQKVEESP